MDYLLDAARPGLLPACPLLRLVPLQLTDLLHRQVAPRTRLKVAQPQEPDMDTQDAHDGQIQLFAGLADLALPALPHDHAHPGSLAQCALKVDIHRRGLVSILEHNAAPAGRGIPFHVRRQDTIVLTHQAYLKAMKNGKPFGKNRFLYWLSKVFNLFCCKVSPLPRL